MFDEFGRSRELIQDIMYIFDFLQLNHSLTNEGWYSENTCMLFYNDELRAEIGTKHWFSLGLLEIIHFGTETSYEHKRYSK